MKKYFVLVVLTFPIIGWLQAQQASVPLLERRVTIMANGRTIESILTDISQQAGFVFSYSPEAINYRHKVTIKAVNKPVNLILSDILEEDIGYKAKGKYVIIKKNKSQKSQDAKVFEGYLFDEKSGERLTEASIYDKNLRVSAVTNQYGYFRMKVPSDKPLTALHVSKIGYSDTMLVSQANLQRKRIIEIALSSQDTSLKKNKSAIRFQKLVPPWLIPRKLKIHSLNLNDSIFRKVQFSLIPLVNTNLLLTGNTENNVSMNLTVGYVYGVRKAEFGGILNIVRTNAGVCQLAGVGNVVGEYSRGFQGAGVLNYARTARGVQSSGVINLVADSTNIQAAGVINHAQEANVQLSGVINEAKQVKIVQASGVYNQASDANIQLSGVVNLATNRSNWQTAGVINLAQETNVQLAGVINRAKEARYVQASGVANLVKTTNNLQTTGVLNYASEFANVQLAGVLNGANTANVQISGLLNIAGQVNNLQLSVINIADSCAGIPIGIFSFVRSGYHKLEFSYDEISTANVSFRTGVKLFHTIFMAGASTRQSLKGLGIYGFGMGTSLGNPNKLLFDIDLSANQFLVNNNFSFNSNLYKLYLGIDKKLTKKISIAAGLSCNLLISDTKSTNYGDTYSKIAPYRIISQTTTGGYNHTTWIGGKIAFRFF